jgi:alpha-amylase/alpha-mannosidase (GH57 family)
MSDESRLRVVLCWHMHQPEYRDLMRGDYQLHWAYLHAIKDYVDMAAHLEAQPAARAVVNFAPLLLEQIDDYARQVHGFLTNRVAIRDPLLAALAGPVLPAGTDGRHALLQSCLRAHERHMIGRFPAYRRLAEMARWLDAHPDVMLYVGDQFLVDLIVWYHLAWLGETVRRNDARVRRLMEQARGYSLHDRRELLAVIGELLGGVIGRYRRLAEAGRVELSVTPYGHPILPLLIDLRSAREALPQLPLPLAPAYPGGAERARWHIDAGLKVFERHFGFRPQGCWPSEGAVSQPALALLEAAGLRWAASGQNVYRNSRRPPDADGKSPPLPDLACLHLPYTVGDGRLACFFRDDGLSDAIGFRYADWHADDAVGELIHNLEQIAAACEDQAGSVVAIILDGENAWEHYPENGYHFLSALYRRLSEHPGLALTTFSACLDAGPPPTRLDRLVAGSWVYGTFSTWIGEADKNRAWDILVDAKRACDAVLAEGRLDESARARIEQQLAVCEGSDWFWWFGDRNPAGTVRDFERLYRLHLANLYQLLGRESPQYLSQRLSFGGGAPALGGVMLPGQNG